MRLVTNPFVVRAAACTFTIIKFRRFGALLDFNLAGTSTVRQQTSAKYYISHVSRVGQFGGFGNFRSIRLWDRCPTDRVRRTCINRSLRSLAQRALVVLCSLCRGLRTQAAMVAPLGRVFSAVLPRARSSVAPLPTVRRRRPLIIPHLLQQRPTRRPPSMLSWHRGVIGDTVASGSRGTVTSGGPFLSAREQSTKSVGLACTSQPIFISQLPQASQ